MSSMERALAAISGIEPRLVVGSVQAVRGLTLLVDRLRVPVGSLVDVDAGEREQALGEVIGFDGGCSLVMLLGSATGVSPGASVRSRSTASVVPIGYGWLGRVVDALGRPIDDGPPLDDLEHRPLDPPIMNPLHRGIITEPLSTGVRAIDGMLTVGRGQRVGIFAGPGVGKSTLLASIAKGTAADIVVIGLVGERGREVKEFLEHTLGPEGRRKACIVAATGDESPLLRVRAATSAIAAAEFFRDQGKHVLLMIDSVTRLAQAQRQIGLAAGEQPATKGFTPSVFSLLSRVLERAGCLERGGSITAFYTVLVEGDDLTEPIADAAKGILDGHFVLSRRIASRGFFPAIDVLESISRVVDNVTNVQQCAARRLLIRFMAAHRAQEELIAIGAYARGSNPEVDTAIAMKPEIEAYLQQDKNEITPYPVACRGLADLARQAADRLAAAMKLREQQPHQQPGTPAHTPPSARR
ncbi:MAG: FliI/YscN family ATPase [Phycisphaerae bacterium]|nr:FliI/YscN family ATPase [Phycisphaerae bacterium]